MQKTKKSLLTSITSIVFTLLNGLCNLIVTRKIIEIYGSDFNGINSTATQFINVLLVIEGGFAIAANVALFKPLSENSYNKVAEIFAATSSKFKKIGLLFTGIGTITTLIFTLLLKTALPYEIRFAIFFMLIISTGFNLFYATKYKILFQSDQREYVLNVISIITYFLTYVVMYVAIIMRWHMLGLRFIVLAFAVINSILVGVMCKKQYPYITEKVQPDFVSIKGTGDVFVQKIVGVIYYAAPIVAISSLVSTAAASVYAVYNAVFTLIRSAENAIINAPRMSLGRLAAEEGVESVRFKDVYNQYEYCMFFSICGMLSVATVLIMPFISIYAKAFYDYSYINWKMAILLILTCYVECIHIPSGNLINMTGKFREGKIIQVIAGVVLFVSLVVGGVFFSLDGILISVLITATVLAILEIGYVRTFLIKRDTISLIRNIMVNTGTAGLLVFLETRITYEISNFAMFFAFVIILCGINFIVLYLINYIFNRTLTKSITRRFLTIFCSGLIKRKR